MAIEEKKWQDLMIDVRNEAIMQGASLYLLLRRVLLAGVGAVALSMDEAQALVDKLAERGEIAEADAYKLVQDLKERVKTGETEIQKAGQQGARQAEDLIEERISAVLNHMNVPSKRDIDQLNRQIELLSAKIDSLRERNRS